MIKSVIAICPICEAKNAWNIYKETIFDTSVEWFMCSFCFKPSDVPEWKQEEIKEEQTHEA